MALKVYGKKFGIVLKVYGEKFSKGAWVWCMAKKILYGAKVKPKGDISLKNKK